MSHWTKNKRLTGVLLSVWVITTLIVGIAPEFMRITFFGWEFTYWFGAQGALFIYLLLVWFYAHNMRNYEKDSTKSSDS